MKLKKANVKRLASLSAVGAGALGVGGGNAVASNIVFSGPLDVFIGSVGNTFTFAGPHGAGGQLKFFSYPETNGTSRWVALHAKRGSHGTNFQFRGSVGGTSRGRIFARGFPVGARWGAGTSFEGFDDFRGGQPCAKPFQKGIVVESVRGCFNSTSRTYFTNKDRYLLFEFSGGKLSHTLYGWAQLAVQVTDVTLVEWAYDTSGAQIPAGDTGTPEPSTFVLTGLSALALGGVGLRRWRRVRR